MTEDRNETVEAPEVVDATVLSEDALGDVSGGIDPTNVLPTTPWRLPKLAN